MSWVEHTVG